MENLYGKRKQMIEDYKEEWNRRLEGRSEEVLKMVRDIEQAEEHDYRRMRLPKQAWKIIEAEGKTPSRLMKENYGELVGLYVPEERQEEFFLIIDKMNQFNYSGLTGGRITRSDSYAPFMDEIFALMFEYKVLGFYGGDLVACIRKELPEALLKYNTYTNRYSMHYLYDMVAAAIDCKDEAVIGSVKEMLASDNNSMGMDKDILQGITRSSDESLQKLLVQVLLSAGIQDGIRGEVCLAAGNGTVQAFRNVFDAICENNLLRFDSVRRLFSGWLGIWNTEGRDLLIKRYLKTLQEVLHSREKALQCCQSSDRVLVYIGLWGLEVCNGDDTLEVIRRFMEEGTKDQLIAMVYYNRELWDSGSRREIARQVIRNREQDKEIAAVFFKDYCLEPKRYLEKAVEKKFSGKSYHQVPLKEYFETEEQAREYFAFFKEMLEKMPDKEWEYQAGIFPWQKEKITVSELVKQLCILAHILQDEELADYAAEHIGEIKRETESGGRADYVELILREPSNEKQLERLVRLVTDKESDTRVMAVKLLDGYSLKASHYEFLEDALRLKNGEIRRNAIRLLKKQSKEQLIISVKRLFESGNGMMREGALDLILEVSKEDEIEPQVMETLREMAARIENPKENEKILLQQILKKEGGDEPASEQEGYGLYRKDARIVIPEQKSDRQAVISYFDIDRSVLDGILEKLAGFIHENKNREYINGDGEEETLGCYLAEPGWFAYKGNYPFKELWMGFYEEEIRDIRTLILLDFCMENRKKVDEQERYSRWENTFFGETVGSYSVPEHIRSVSYAMRKVLHILMDIYERGELGRIGLELFRWLFEDMPEEEMWYEETFERGYGFGSSRISFLNSQNMDKMKRAAEKCAGAQVFLKRFYLYVQMDEKYGFQEKEAEGYSYKYRNYNLLGLQEYVKACSLDAIPEDIIYQKIFEEWGLGYALEELEPFVEEESYGSAERRMHGLMNGTEEENRRFMETGLRIYTRLVDRVLEVELKRGQMPTVFSKNIRDIVRIYGMERFTEILKALGTEKLDRNGYWRFRGQEGKKECLSHLLSVCMPRKEDNGQRLKEMLKGKKGGKAVIADRRLIEAGMYAPQWLGILEEYFGFPGFQSGCCYFIAHMDAGFGKRMEAQIARYTPLTVQELWGGAFDSQWFMQVYDTLGEERFSWLYDAAKYISNGGKHIRARKYADAVLGKVTVEELEKEITAKRNKDVLMSYGLVPLRDKSDMLRRYEFLQQFLKESKKFGSMRRASEAEAVKMALRNMASMAGYADTMRLTLAMEGETVKAYRKYMEWQDVEEIRVRLVVNDYGIPQIDCEKDGKMLKSVPAKYKKTEWIAGLSVVYRKLKEQNQRCIRMFERAMKEREGFRYDELLELNENPVAGPILRTLVFAEKKEDGKKRSSGYFSERGLLAPEGKVIPVNGDAVLWVAHPVDLFYEGTLEAYQRGCYDDIASGIVRKQPFKQLFREFYVKQPDELEQRKSRMFAGYQVQPLKALACLKGQGWIANVEEGIQKICYEENIIAGIRVLSDLMMPEDLETPSIEWIEFYDRMNHKDMRIRDVPEVVYSEIMRDVDLAVSVAYAGGTDPETCRSTVEMRKVIAEYNLSLFGLCNVGFVKNHAQIKGKRGDYTVHMGSGVVHRKGGPQIYIKAVPAQRRGRIFLPFIDEDPKTAQIMSEIILFAQDDKIKDPDILRQIGDVVK